MKRKLVVITGANSGVGLEMAKAFTLSGHPCLLLGRNIDVVSALNLPNAICKRVDVSDRLAFREALDIAEAEYGSVDCLINNAGVMYLSDIGEQPEQQWKSMFSANVDGVINGVQEVVKSMKINHSGTIVNMGSLGGVKPLDNHGLYCASKAAVHSLSEILRQELSGFGIRVSTIAPGAIKTNLIEKTTDSAMVSGHNDYVSSIGGALSAEDIANLALYLYQLPTHICLREIVVAATRQKI